ncbi:putative reverse transcriptase zinc-binding domain-containing protein [Helianthus annuus]|nr:putative reverse transcriptase zinc-binding domain-containing protein [Helianthus annuus]
MEVYPNLFRFEAKKDCLVAERCIIRNGQKTMDWNWKSAIIGGSKAAELFNILMDIFQVEAKPCSDKWVWSKEKDGSFSVASVKKALMSPLSGSRGSMKFDLNAWVPIKVKIFGWRAMLNRLPTMDMLIKRKIVTGPNRCSLCLGAVESIDHVFAACLVASVIWQKISLWCRISPIFAFSFKDLLEVHKYILGNKTKKKVIQSVIVVACWCLWKARNEIIFSNRPVKVEKIMGDVMAYSFLWIKSRAKNVELDWNWWKVFLL